MALGDWWAATLEHSLARTSGKNRPRVDMVETHDKAGEIEKSETARKLKASDIQLTSP